MGNRFAGPRPDWTNALDGDLPHGSANRVRRRLATGRVDDDRIGPAIWDQPEDLLPVGRPLRGRSRARLSRALARPKDARSSDGGRHPCGGPRAAPRVSSLGPEEASGGAPRAGAAARVAGGEHDGRSAPPRGGEYAAPPRPIWGAVDA